jgi:hypothetical protein
MPKRSERTKPVRVTRTAALILLGLGCLIASAGAFAASYEGNWEWAATHGLAGWRAYHWPVAADVMMAVGELALLVAIIDEFTDKTITWLGVALATAGLAVSVLGNWVHAAGDLPSRFTWALFPVVAGGCLAAGLLVLKSVIAGTEARASVRTPASDEGGKREPPASHPARRRTPKADKAAAEAKVAGLLAGLPLDALPSANALALEHLHGDRRAAQRRLDARRAQGEVAR